jgi:hypothetical protein
MPQRRMTTKPWKTRDGCNPKLPNFPSPINPLSLVRGILDYHIFTKVVFLTMKRISKMTKTRKRMQN